MKTFALMTVLAGLLVTTGCTSVLYLDPVVDEKDARWDQALVGTWKSTEDKDFAVILADSANTYRIDYHSDSDVYKFDARLTLAGPAWVLDLVRHDDCPFAIPAHFLVRVWVDSETLRWTFLDSKWIQEQMAQKPLALRKLDKDSALVTAEAPAVREFLGAVASDERAHGDVARFQRLK
jgi:hypothetical protein